MNVVTPKSFIIAEAGVNHNGDLSTAAAMIGAAAEAGVDAVKFQSFRTDELVTRTAPLAEYQRTSMGEYESQYELLQRLELSESAHFQLRALCLDRNLEFLSTPFDPVSLTFLVEKCQVARLKIPSGEISNAPLLLAAARSGRPLIMSTGMSTLKDIENALSVIAFGCVDTAQKPGREGFWKAYSSEEGQCALRERVTLLHCVTEYPTPFKDMNLRAMQTLTSAFGLQVGLSDHTVGTAVPIAAVALGAVLIEKHFTLDRGMRGPDHRASLEPSELAEMVRCIRQVESALGHGRKVPALSELGNVSVAGKSIVARRAIASGEAFTEENLAIRRPSGGISPLEYFDLIGKVSQRSYEQDENIMR